MLVRYLVTVALLSSCAAAPLRFNAGTSQGAGEGPVRATYRCRPALPSDPVSEEGKKFSVVWICDLDDITVEPKPLIEAFNGY